MFADVLECNNTHVTTNFMKKYNNLFEERIHNKGTSLCKFVVIDK